MPFMGNWFTPLFDLNTALAYSSSLTRNAPVLTVAACVIALAFYAMYQISGRKDFLVLACCAVAYAIVPLM